MKKIVLTEKQAEFINRIINEDHSHGHQQQKPMYSYKDKLRLVKDKNIKDGGNFPIERNGKVYWVSRSNTVFLYCYCKNSVGEWCVLASKRGPQNHVSPNSWNVVGGFLDYGYTLEETCVEECWEETGVKIDTSVLKKIGTFSDRRYSEVASIYYAVLDGTTDQYPTSIDNCEPGEVSQAAWIPLNQSGKLKWMGNQGRRVIETANTYLIDDNISSNDSYRQVIDGLHSLLDNHLIDSNKYNTILQLLKNNENV